MYYHPYRNRTIFKIAKFSINTNIILNNQLDNRIDYHMNYNNMNKELFFGTAKAILKSEKNLKK